MRYLYGDSTPFPLNQNFIVTLAAVTDCAVELLKVDEKIQRHRKVTNEANAAAANEIRNIDRLAKRLDAALQPRDSLSQATAKVVETVLATAKGQFSNAKAGVKSWRDSTIGKSGQGCRPADIMAPIHRFMVKEELPYTSWGLRWKSGAVDQPVQAQVYAILQRGLTATLSVAIAPKHIWAQPVRISQLLDKPIVIKLMGKNWLGREKLQDVHLEKYYVTRITCTAERHQLILSKKPKEPAGGLKISVREGDSSRVLVTRIDDDENALGSPAALEGADGQLVKQLWRRVEETIADLVKQRHRLLAATLHDKRVIELDTPATVAVAMIQSVAPLVRDMKRHSRTPGELQLKRDLGDGRREELFISEAEIVAKYQVLSPRNQQLFDCCGLKTTQVTREAKPQQSVAVQSAEQLYMSLSEQSHPELPSSDQKRHPRSPARAVSESAESVSPVSRPPETSPLPDLSAASSDFAPPMPSAPTADVAAAPRVPNLIPPPSNPRGGRRADTSGEPSRSRGDVFRLPPPSAPPKPMRRRVTKSKLRVVNG